MLTIRLKNFRRFLSNTDEDQHKATFAPGLTIVTGPNGAGKSTLTEAVEFCLFGSKGGRGGRSDERSDTAASDLEVCCTFEVDGQLVTAQRGGGGASLTIDGTPQALTRSAVKNELARLLQGLTREDYEQIYVASQGETAGLVQAKASDRQKAIERILQFDVLLTAVELQKQLRDQAKSTVRSQGGRVVDELNLISEYRETLQDALRAIKLDSSVGHLRSFIQRSRERTTERRHAADVAKQVREAADKTVSETILMRDQAEAAHLAAQRAVQTLDELANQFHEHQLEIHTCQGQANALLRDVEHLQQQCVQAQQFAGEASRYNDVQREIRAVEWRLKTLGTIKERHGALRRAQGIVSELVARLDDYADVPQLIDAANQALKQCRDMAKEVEVDPTIEKDRSFHGASDVLIRDEKETKEALAALGRTESESECPTCERPLGPDERHKLVDRFRAQVEEEFPRRRAELDETRRGIEREREAWELQKLDAEQAVERANRELVSVQQRATARDMVNQQIEEAQKEQERAERDWIQLNEPSYDPDEASCLETSLPQLIQEANQLRPNAELYSRLPEYQSAMQQKQTAAAGWQQKVADHQVALVSLGYAPEVHSKAKDEQKLAAESFATAERALGRASTERERLNNEESKAIAAAERGESEVDRLDDDMKQLEEAWTLLELLDQFKDHFFTANTRLVAKRTTELILQAVSDGSITGIEFGSRGELVYLDESHSPRSVERLSGGEKALLGLCLRIALAERALRNVSRGRLDFLFLDEVLSALDDERREGVQRVLDEVQRQGVFRHIIMITHLDAVKDGWRGEILEVRKLDGKKSQLIAGKSANSLDGSEWESDEDSLP